MFCTVPLSIITNYTYSLHTQQWHISYRFPDSFRAVSGWNSSSILILLESCQQTCMTYTTAVYTVNSSWWWTDELYETCEISFQNKFEKLVHMLGFIIRKFVTMHGHMNVKLCHSIRSKLILSGWSLRRISYQGTQDTFYCLKYMI
jgi:hypothetical protein